MRDNRQQKCLAPYQKAGRCQQGAAPKGKLANGYQVLALPAQQEGQRAAERLVSLLEGKRCQQRTTPKGGEITYSDQVLDLFGGTKVCQLDPAGIVHQDVGPLDITVHDVVLVQVLQAQQDLAAIHPHHGLLECA